MRWFSRAAQFPLGVEPVGEVVAVNGTAREENLIGSRAYGFEVISVFEPAPSAPLCAAVPLDSCIVGATALAALLVRRRPVVPFPFLTVAISCKNLLAKTSESNVSVYEIFA